MGVAEGERGASVPLSLAAFPESPLMPTLPHSFVPCSEKIHLAVTEMASLFPKVQDQRGAGLGGPRVGQVRTPRALTSTHG